jgi:hypothetical protein
MRKSTTGTLVPKSHRHHDRHRENRRIGEPIVLFAFGQHVLHRSQPCSEQDEPDRVDWTRNRFARVAQEQHQDDRRKRARHDVDIEDEIP